MYFIGVHLFTLLVIYVKSSKSLGHESYVECGSIENPFNAVAFKILPFSSCTPVPVFIQLFETVVGPIMNNLLQYGL